MRIAIIAALAGELAPLVKGWKRVPHPDKTVLIWRRPVLPQGATPDDVVAVCAGMGAEAAVRAFAAAEQGGRVDLVVSVGWSGALVEELQAGMCSVLSEVIDAMTGERFPLTDGKRKLRLVTTPRVADAAEKKRLYATYGAVMVDMEAATIARLARMRDIPMVCIKAVSDGVHAKLPDMNPYIDARGQMRMTAFVAHVLIRPWLWPELIGLGQQSAAGAKELAKRLEAFLVEKDWERVNRTGGVQ